MRILTPAHQSGSYALVFLIPVLLAAALRLPDLAHRPMHCDEAVHAAKLGTLLDEGRYEYSTVDYHGPTLYYLTLLSAGIQSQTQYIDLTETTLRAVPAVIGVLLVAASFFMIPYIGFPSAFLGAVLAAVSPAMVYYSRYYIHEMLLVFFTFCALLTGFRYWKSHKPSSAVVTGICVALMVATKETAVLAFGCMFLAVLGVYGLNRLRGEAPESKAVSWYPLLYASGAALAAAGLLFSSFLTNPAGIKDAVLAYETYIGRAVGLGTMHVQPWHYYLNLLLYFRSGGGPAWTEFSIFALAVFGAVAVLRNKSSEAGVVQFLTFYSVLMTAVYCAIPYKAPWNLLGFLHGWILLAGIGSARLLRSAGKPVVRFGIAALLVLCFAHLGSQAWSASFRYAADPRNPWVYGHTGEDVHLIVESLVTLAAAHPGHYAIPVQIISGENLWPLPWYLRRFPGVRWSPEVYDSIPNAPVIFITPDMESALVHKLYEVPPPGRREMYMRLFDRYVELRPQVEIRGYVAKTLWDEWQRAAGQSRANLR